MTSQLPEAFTALQDFAAKWVLATEKERRHERMANSTQAELQALYDAVYPRLDEIIEYLNGFPVNDMPEAENNLMLLLLSYVEVSPAIELFGQPVPPDSFQWQRFECTF